MADIADFFFWRDLQTVDVIGDVSHREGDMGGETVFRFIHKD